MKNKNLKILLTSPRGFCAGVDRAIEIVKKSLDKYGSPIYVRHEIVHNKNVVDSLQKIGAIFIEELEEIFVGMDTSYAPTDSLKNNIIYYWQVYAYNLAGSKTYAKNSYFKFAIEEDIPPEQFSILFPQNDTTLTTLYPTFSWSSSKINNLLDSTFYVLELGENDVQLGGNEVEMR